MLSLKLAFRNVLRQRRRTVLTIMSMTAGYLLCAFALSMQLGSYGGSIEFFVRDHTTHIQIHKSDYLKRPKLQKTIRDPASIVNLLETDLFVASVTSRVFAPALAYSSDQSTPANIQGVDVERERATTTLADKVTRGRYFNRTANPDGYFEAMIGHGVADLLGISVGAELILISSGADGSIANDVFLVSGIIGTRRSADRLNVFLPLEAAQQFLSMGPRVHQIAIMLNANKGTIEYASQLQQRMDSATAGGPDEELTASPWQHVKEAFYKTMVADLQSMYFSLGVIVFIVCIGVLNTVLMSVLERTREFGVLRAIGTKPLHITRMIFLENFILSSMSCVLGFALALPLVYWLSSIGISLPEPVEVGGISMSHLKGELSARIFTTPLLLIVITALIVCIPPGLRAARVSPIQALGSH